MQDGKYGDIPTITYQKGPQPSLSWDFEIQIWCFIEDSYHMGLPRCKGKLAMDIQYYLNHFEMDVKNFENRKPVTKFVITFSICCHQFL